jgi:hypothetical protein
MKSFGICSECKEHCEIIEDDGCEMLEGPSGRLVKTAVRQPEYVSNCCYAPVLDPTGPEVDEVEVPGGHLPYGGGK